LSITVQDMAFILGVSRKTLSSAWSKTPRCVRRKSFVAIIKTKQGEWIRPGRCSEWRSREYRKIFVSKKPLKALYDKRLKVSVQALSKIINCRGAVTLDMALRLSRAFDTTPELWLNLQKIWFMACCKWFKILGKR
jgi:plasmid maintenance system antidote protein VapI